MADDERTLGFPHGVSMNSMNDNSSAKSIDSTAFEAGIAGFQSRDRSLHRSEGDVERDFEKDFEKHIGPDFEKAFEKHIGPDFDKDIEKNIGKDFDFAFDDPGISNETLDEPERTLQLPERPVLPPKDEEPSNLVQWDGSDDPENPMNWTFGKKIYITALPAIMTF